MIVKGGCRLGRHDELFSPVRLVVTRLASGELLALACSGRAVMRSRVIANAGR